MKYEAVIAILDGVPDSTGDILTDNVKLPTGPVLVMNDFQGAATGLAWITRDGDKLLAEIDFYESPSPIPPEYYEAFKGSVGGEVIKRNGVVIEEWRLDSVSITTNPSDKRLPNLKRKL